jgi:hypothetical protein
MKRLMMTLLISGLLLAACSAPATSPAVVESTPLAQATLAEAGQAPVSTPQPASEDTLAAEYLTTEFEDATSLRNQLAFGILKLEGTAQAISPEQAKTLLPLWQAMVALSGTTTTVPEELTAVQDQIVEGLTTEQLQAIAALQLTNAQLTEFYAENGIYQPTPVPGVTKVPGSKKDMSEADRLATRTANEAAGITGTGSGQASRTFLFEKVIELLSARAAE